MVFIANCPQCARKLQVPSTCRGETVRCPACEATFPAPEPPETVSSRVPTTPSGTQAGASAVTLAVVEGLPGEESSAPPDESTGWTAQDGWRRVHSGLGWIALGVAASFVVLFLQSLPALLPLTGVDLAAPHDDDFWNEPHNLVHPLRSTVGLTVLFSTFCLLAGLFRCLLYPVRGPGALLAGVAFALGVCWGLGWVWDEGYQLVWGSGYRLLGPRSLPYQGQEPGVLTILGLLQLAAFVLFLWKLGRDCADQTVLTRVRWLLVSVVALAGPGTACLVLIGISGCPTSVVEVLPFLALLMLQAQMLRLVLAAREAARRRSTRLLCCA